LLALRSGKEFITKFLANGRLTIRLEAILNAFARVCRFILYTFTPRCFECFANCLLELLGCALLGPAQKEWVQVFVYVIFVLQFLHCLLVDHEQAVAGVGTFGARFDLLFKVWSVRTRTCIVIIFVRNSLESDHLPFGVIS
jgi:hypothetical protein